MSKIDELFAMGTQEIYRVPCPHCNHHHELVLENFHYRRDEETGFMDRAWFVCPECGSEIEERYKSTIFLDAEEGGTAHWHPTAKGDGETISFTMSAFYMPIGAISWLSLARQYDPLLLGILQMGFLAVYSTAGMVLFESPAVPADTTTWGAILALVFICSVFGFTFQPVA